MGDHAAPSPFWRDALERVIWTFLEAFTAALLVAGVFDLETLEAASLAGVTAVLAVVKTIAATQLGKSGSAAIGA